MSGHRHLVYMWHDAHSLPVVASSINHSIINHWSVITPFTIHNMTRRH